MELNTECRITMIEAMSVKFRQENGGDLGVERSWQKEYRAHQQFVLRV